MQQHEDASPAAFLRLVLGPGNRFPNKTFASTARCIGCRGCQAACKQWHDLPGELPLLFTFDRYSLLMWLELGVGCILPMIIFFVPRLRTQRRWQVTGALLILFSVLMNRFNATLFAQFAREGASYTPHILEWLSTLGVLSAAALAWYFGIRFLSIFDSDAHAKFHH